MSGMNSQCTLAVRRAVSSNCLSDYAVTMWTNRIATKAAAQPIYTKRYYESFSHSLRPTLPRRIFLKSRSGDATLPMASSVPDSFLRGSPPALEKEKIDFATTAIPEYRGRYATVIDGCFTKEECEELIRLAAASNSGNWEQAMVNVGGGRQELAIESRNCGRIIYDNQDMAQRIWDRVKVALGEIEVLEDMPLVTGLRFFQDKSKNKLVWEMSRLNERMRFLKYNKAQYFKRELVAFTWD